VAGCGGCFACAEAIALDGQGGQAGTASSVYGFATFTVAGLVSPLAGLVGIADSTPVAAVLVATSAISLVGVGLIVRARAGIHHGETSEPAAPGRPG
jgi:DHA1 family bicyclomycin/chloramphenicol resistance-like MFS transporter